MTHSSTWTTVYCPLILYNPKYFKNCLSNTYLHTYKKTEVILVKYVGLRLSFPTKDLLLCVSETIKANIAKRNNFAAAVLCHWKLFGCSSHCLLSHTLKNLNFPKAFVTALRLRFDSTKKNCSSCFLKRLVNGSLQMSRRNESWAHFISSY